MPNVEIPVQTLSQIFVKCSFCRKEVREDRKVSGEYGSDNQNYHFRSMLHQKGWRAALTNEKFELTLCPDHVEDARLMGLDVR